MLAIEAGGVSFFLLLLFLSFFFVKSQFAFNTHRVSLQTKTRSDGKERMEGSGIDGGNGKVCESESAV